MAAPAKHNPRSAHLPDVRSRDRPDLFRSIGCRPRWRMSPKAACRGRAPTCLMNEAHPRGQRGRNHPGMRCRGPSSTNQMHARRSRRIACPTPARRPSLWRAFRWGRCRGADHAGTHRLPAQPGGRAPLAVASCDGPSPRLTAAQPTASATVRLESRAHQSPSSARPTGESYHPWEDDYRNSERLTIGKSNWNKLAVPIGVQYVFGW